jgi:hypothetical protein
MKTMLTLTSRALATIAAGAAPARTRQTKDIVLLPPSK